MHDLYFDVGMVFGNHGLHLVLDGLYYCMDGLGHGLDRPYYHDLHDL